MRTVNVLAADEHKLDQLHARQVALPREGDLEGGQGVVRVHDDMHKGVEQHRQVEVTGERVRQDGADDDRNAAVVVRVQEGHLAERAAQQEEPRVQELPVLLNVKHPDGPAETAGKCASG